MVTAMTLLKSYNCAIRDCYRDTFIWGLRLYLCGVGVQVFQGVLLAAGARFALPKAGEPAPSSFAGSVTSPEGYLLALWQHESLRTFCDKMISAEDKTWITDAITGLCKYASLSIILTHWPGPSDPLLKSACSCLDIGSARRSLKRKTTM